MTQEWVYDYDNYRPHSTLDKLKPIEYLDNQKNITFRLDLDYIELKALLELLKKSQKNKKIKDEFNYLINNREILKKVKTIHKSSKKSDAALTATAARSKKAKEKIDNAINILRMENKKITCYSIAKMAEVSYNTVKKYLTNEDIKQLNI